MVQLEALEFLKKPSPVSESILEQTDEVFPPIDDKKEAFIEQQAIPFDEKDAAVDMPKIHEEIDTSEFDALEIDTSEFDDLMVSTAKIEEDIKATTLDDELIWANQAMFLKDDKSMDYIRSHPAWDIAEDMPSLFQEEFFDYYYDQVQNLNALSGEEGLQPLQFIGELSIAQGLRNTAQGLIDISNYLSPFYGGDSWWNGFGKGRTDFSEGIDPKGQKAILLPSLRTPGGAIDKSLQLVTEYFAPSGALVKGSKLLSQVMTGSNKVKKLVGQFGRGENIGAFAVGFGAVDMALVEPDMKNLAAFIQDHKELEGPIGWFLDKLATDPDNPEWQNRFVRTLEGMGIGFTFESALWLTKVLTYGVSKGTIHVVQPLDQELFQYMKTNMPEDITIAQRIWGTLQEYSPKSLLENLIYRNMDEQYAFRLIEGEAEEMGQRWIIPGLVKGEKLPSVVTLRSKELLDEFSRLKKLPQNKGLPDDQLRAMSEINIGKVGTGGKSVWAEFKLLKAVGRVIDNFFNEGTSTWRSLDETGKVRLDYGKLEITGPSFTKSLSEFITTKTQLKDFMHYLVAKRALKLQERGFKGKKILKNWNQKKLSQIVKNGDTNSAFVGALKNLQDYNKRLMDFAVDSGLFSREAADKMLKENPVYVPFYRVTQSVGVDGLLQNEIKAATRAKPVEKFRGGGGMIDDPYQSLLKNTAVIVEAALRNRANQTLSYYIDKVYVKRVKEITKIADEKNLKGKERKYFIDNYSTKWAEKVSAADMAGYVRIDKKKLQEQLEKQGVTGINLDDASVDEYLKVLYFNNRNIRTPNGELIFVANFKGKPSYYKITDEMLKNAVDTFGWKSFEYQGWVMKSLAKNKAMVSWLITRDPSFAMYANPVRDSWGGAINSTSWSRIPILDTTIGIQKMLSYYFGKNPQNHQLALDYLNNGGGFGTIFTKNAEQYAFQVKKYFNKKLNIPLDDIITNPKQLGRHYGNFVGAFEHATRIREYDKLIKAGYSPREAAVMSREISIDFSMKGASHMMTGFTQSVAFLNPGIQGLYKSMRTWLGEGRFTKTFIQTNMYVGAPTAMLWAMNHDNPDYQAYPDWAKRQAWFIPVGKVYDEALGRERTRFLLIPKPFDLFGMYANATEALFQSGWEALGANPDSSTIMWEFINAMGGNIKHALPPVPLPPSVSAALAVAANVDSFTGMNIIPGRLEGAPEHFQYTPWSHETTIALGNMTGISPLKIEAVISKIFPGLGEYFLHGLDFFTNEVSKKYFDYDWDMSGPITLEDIPVLDRAYEDGIPTISSQEIEAYDKVIEGLDDYISDSLLSELFIMDQKRLTNWLNDGDNLEKISQRPVFYNYLMQTNELNALIRKYQRRQDMDKKDKQREIIYLQEQKRKMATEFLQVLKDRGID